MTQKVITINCIYILIADLCKQIFILSLAQTGMYAFHLTPKSLPGYPFKSELPKNVLQNPKLVAELLKKKILSKPDNC